MTDILPLLNAQYPWRFDRLAFARESVSMAYTAFAGSEKYFLRCVKPLGVEQARTGVDVQVFLQRQGFPVPSVLLTEDGAPYVEDGDCLHILYEFIEGVEADPARNAKALGALVGELHRVMKDYPGTLVRRDKHYYIDKYIDILRARQYPGAEEFAALGDALWKKVKSLPRGCCHGDMYRGNFLNNPHLPSVVNHAL